MKSLGKHIGELLAAPAGLSGRVLVAVSLASVMMTALLLSFIAPVLLAGGQRYDDLVVGEITFADAFKHGDIVTSFVAVMLYFAVWWLTALLVARRCAEQEAETKPEPESALQWLPCLFFCYYAGTMLFRTDAGYWEIGVSLLLLVVYLFLLKLPGGEGVPGRTAFGVLAGVVTAGGIYFSLAGLEVAAKFFFPQAIPSWYPAELPLYAGGAGLLALPFLARAPQRSQLRIAHLTQLLTPLLVLAGFTRVYQSAEGVTGNLAPLSTKCLAITLALALLVAGARLFSRKAGLAAAKPRDLLLLPSVVAVTTFFVYDTPKFLSTDLFHYGELLLAWQQIFAKGQFPFTGFAVARGFGDAMSGMMNSLLFDGTFATFTFGISAYGAGVAALNSLLFCALLGTGWGLVLGFASGFVGISLAVFLLFVQPKLLARPLLWLFAWVLVCPLYCLFHTTSGIALTVGTFPVAAWAVYAAIKEGHLAEAWRGSRRRLIAAVAVAVTVLCLLSPLVFAWVTYVLEQGKVNEIANGTALLRELAIPTWFRWQNRWAWEGFRIGGWLLGIFLLWHLYVRERGRRLQAGGATMLGSMEAIALMGIVSTIITIPYSMGRIDSKVLSRTGATTILVLSVLLPLVLILKKRGRQVPALFAAALLLGIGNSAYYSSPASLASKAVRGVEVPGGAVWTEGKLVSPLFGDTFADPETLANLAAIKGVTDKVIRPGESYLDLTNHVGYYYLLNYKVPAVYAGYYTVASEEVQNRVIRALQHDPPPLVWTGPARTFGSGTASLRSYRLYRWLLQNRYVPMQANGLSFLVREDRYKTLFPVLPPLTQQTRELAATFDNPYLGGIPLAWGRNMDRLGPRFRRGSIDLRQTALTQGSFQEARDRQPVPVVTLELAASQPVSGGEYDFLLLRFTGAGGPVQVRASWSEPGTAFADWRSVVFEAQSGAPLLIPLGSHPDWLLSRDIGRIKFEIFGMERAADLMLDPPVFLSLIK